MSKKQQKGDVRVPKERKSASTLPGSLILHLDVHLSIEHSIIHFSPNNPAQQ